MKKKNYEFPMMEVRGTKIRANILAGSNGSVNNVTLNGYDIPFVEVRKSGSRD